MTERNLGKNHSIEPRFTFLQGEVKRKGQETSLPLEGQEVRGQVVVINHQFYVNPELVKPEHGYIEQGVFIPSGLLSTAEQQLTIGNKVQISAQQMKEGEDIVLVGRNVTPFGSTPETPKVESQTQQPALPEANVIPPQAA